jgi:hypothetical protein
MFKNENRIFKCNKYYLKTMPKMIKFFIFTAIMMFWCGIFSRTISLIIWFTFIFSIVIYWYSIKMKSKQEKKLKIMCLLLFWIYVFSQLIPYDITFRYKRHIQNKSITVLPIVCIYAGSWEKKRKLDESGKIYDQDYVLYYLSGQITLPPRYAIVIYIHFY